MATERLIKRLEGWAMAFTVEWNLTGSETGDFAMQVDANDRSIQIDGVFAGGSASVEGSNDGVSWYVLNDPQGNPLTFSTPRLEAILEMTSFIRVKSSGVTSIKAVMYVRGQVN